MKKYLLILLFLTFFTIVGCGDSHKHSFSQGVCECGEVDPDYIPPHTHSFIEGKCSCGEVDSTYVPPHTHKFVNGVCSCGEKEALKNLDSDIEMHTIQYKYDELTKTEYGYIYIGYYPQKEIKDPSIIKSIMEFVKKQ